MPGILGDKFGRFNRHAAAGLSTGVLCFCWVKTAGIIVLSVAFGFASGAIISGSSIVLTQCTKDPKEVGTYMGQGIAVGSLSVLIALPVSGVLLRTYGGFDEVSVFCGAMTMAGVLFIVGANALTEQGLLGRV
ncbi:MFS transporter [Candidatus Bathyarchaeota archaeon]|nr:MFS transporter [Candidatus Bathyarchaeota archaeon]